MTMMLDVGSHPMQDVTLIPGLSAIENRYAAVVSDVWGVLHNGVVGYQEAGEADQFLETQLKPAALSAAAAESGQQLELRLHAGYDHSYWFIQSFIADHIAHHARTLLAGM